MRERVMAVKSGLRSRNRAPQARMATIAKASQGFIYLVSVTGVTGVKEQMEARVEGLVENLHKVTDKPVRLCCGTYC